MEHIELFVLLALVGSGYFLYSSNKVLGLTEENKTKMTEKVQHDFDLEKKNLLTSLEKANSEVSRLQGVCGRLQSPKSLQDTNEADIWERLSNLVHIRVSAMLSNQFETREALKNFISEDLEGVISFEEFCFLLEGLDFCLKTAFFANRELQITSYFKVQNKEGKFALIGVDGNVSDDRGIINVWDASRSGW